MNKLLSSSSSLHLVKKRKRMTNMDIKLHLKIKELDAEPDKDLPHLPIVICGPSGVGKSTLIRRLQKEFPGKFHLSISHTTRPPRKGEEDGVDYHFVTKEEFEKIDFIEHSTFAGNFYGTSKGALEDNGKYCVILDLNLEGVMNIQRFNIPSLCIIILPPSRKELKKRLVGRGEPSSSIIKRLKEADILENECERVKWDKTIVNDNLEQAYKEFKAFIV